MLTNNFTDIPDFVTRAAYKHVICNTYIPKVCIKTCVNSTAPPSRGRAAMSQHLTKRVARLEIQESKCMK